MFQISWLFSQGFETVKSKAAELPSCPSYFLW